MLLPTASLAIVSFALNAWYMVAIFSLPAGCPSRLVEAGHKYLQLSSQCPFDYCNYPAAGRCNILATHT